MACEGFDNNAALFFVEKLTAVHDASADSFVILPGILERPIYFKERRWRSFARRGEAETFHSLECT